MEQFLIQQILHNLRLHLNSILFLILRKWQTSIRLILVTFIFLGWVIFSSVTNILSLLTLFLASCYSPKLLLTIYLVFLAFLISYLLLTQSNCGFKFDYFGIYFSSDFIFCKTAHQFSRALKFFLKILWLFALQNLRNTIFPIN